MKEIYHYHLRHSTKGGYKRLVIDGGVIRRKQLNNFGSRSYSARR